MGDYEKDDLDFLEPEQKAWGTGDQASFSHQLLVQEAYRRCLQALSVQMQKGFMQQKLDRMGNLLYENIPDTRMVAIECIRTLKNSMIADLQETEHLKKVQELEEKSEGLLDKYLGAQNKWFSSFTPLKRGEVLKAIGTYSPDVLSEKLDFYHCLLDERVEIHRKMFEELELCLHALGYFKKTQRGN